MLGIFGLLLCDLMVHLGTDLKASGQKCPGIVLGCHSDDKLMNASKFSMHMSLVLTRKSVVMIG